MKRYLLIALLTLAGCGKTYEGFDSTVLKHVEAFRAAATDRGYDTSNCPLEFAVVRDDYHGEDLGECHGKGISISRKLTEGFYKSFTTYAEFVVYHELGHCWLGLGHEKTGIMQTGNVPMGWSVQKQSDLDNLFALVPPHGCIKRRAALSR
jgi:hypothetical protein